MIRIAVCDDEEYYRRYISEFVNKFFKSNKITCSADVFNDGISLCNNIECLKMYDIIFLDIEMKKKSGMDTAYYIRKLNKTVQIVFVTVIVDLAIEGYRVNAFRYLLKSSIEQTLPECLYSLLKVIERKDDKNMEFNFVGGKKFICLNDLIYIESASHKINFYLKNKKYLLYGKIDDIENELEGFGFIRTHQSYMVNMKHIEKISNYTVYVDTGAKIRATKPRYKEIKNQFSRYKED